MLPFSTKKLISLLFISSFAFAVHAQNQALNLSGTGNEVNVTYNLATGPGFTVEQWIYIPTITAGVSLVNQSNTNLAAPLDLYVQADGALNLWTGDGATTNNTVSSIGAISAATWHHVAVVYDPADVGNERKIYLDGNTTPLIQGASPALANIGPIRIGRRADGFEGDDIYFDEVRIWSTARDGAAINSDYNQELIGNEANLDVYLRFENDLNDDAFVNLFQNGNLVAGSINYVAGAPIQENNYSLSFDGVDEYLTTDNGAAKQINQGTIEAWVLASSSTAVDWSGIAVKQLAYGMFVRSDVNANFGVYDWNASFYNSSGVSITDDAWHHVAFTFDSGVPGGSQLYLDGVAVGPAFTYTINAQTNDFVMAAGAPGGLQHLNGNLDEVRIWNTVRSASQINAFKDVEVSSLMPGLIAYYNFSDGPNTGTVSDLKGGNPGLLTNMEVQDDWTPATHGVGPAGPLDTTDPDVSITSLESDPTASTLFEVTITFTEEVAGFDLSDITVTNGTPSNLNTADNIEYTVDIAPTAGGVVSVDVFSAVSTDLTGNFNTSAPTFSITYDVELPVIIATTLSAARNRIYVEFDESVYGAADGSTPVDAADFTVNTTGGSASVIVNSLNVLSPSEIEFDITISGSPDGAEVVDVTPNATSVYDAVGNIMSTVQSSNEVGLIDQSVLSLDGVDDFVRIPADVAFDNQNYTLEAWVNFPDPAPTGNDMYSVVSKGVLNQDGLPDLNGYSLLYGDNGGTVGILLGHKSSAGVEFFQHPVTFNANQWYHIAGTFDGSEMKIFLDGVEVAVHSSLVAFDIDHAGDFQDLKIGVFEGNTNGNFLRGKVDEVRVWNYARNDAQIDALRDEEISGTQNGLVAYYNFNEASGSTLTDLVAARNGTLDPAMDLTGASGNWASGGTTLALADATAPSITFAQNLQTIGSTIIGGTHDDNLAAIEVSLDGGTTRTLAINNGDGTWNYDMSIDPNFGGDGPYSLNIYITDEAENEGNTVGNVTIDLQNTLSFDGVDDYVEAPDAASLDITGALTLETWVFFNTAIDEETPLITKWNPDAAPEQRSYLFQIDNTSQVTFAVSTDGTTGAEGTNFSAVQVPYTFQTGRWYHIAATYEPSTYVRVYVNGEQIGENTTSVMPSIFNSNASLVLGDNGNQTEVGVGGVITGEAMEMDEVRVWSVARTQAEIQGAISAELTGSEPNLEAYYDFNLSAGTTLTDITSNANNATLNDNNNGVADGSTAGPIWGASTVFDADVLAPFFVSGFPLIDNIAGTSFDINVQLDEPGRAYYVLLLDGAAAPTATEVFGATGSGGAIPENAGNWAVLTANTTATISSTSLATGTDFDLYIVAEDDEGTPNEQRIVSQFDVTTLAGSQVFNVTNLNDAGAGSLRQAIIDANGDAGATPGDPHIINFSVPGQVTLLDALPAIANHMQFQGDVAGTTIHRDGAQEDFRIFDMGAFTVNVWDIIIDNGRMATANDDGGGILANGTTLTLFNSVVQNCTAERFGGGIYAIGNSNVTLERVTIYNNQTLNVGGWGGGIGIQTGTLEMISNTVHGNVSGGNGGGIFLWNGVNFILRNSTVVNNNSGANGGGIVDQNTTNTYQFTNNIIANNTASGTGNDIYQTSVVYSVNNNNIVEDCGGTACPIFFSTADPNLGLEQSCGIQTYFPLNVGSPAIESGTTTGAASDDICENSYATLPNIGSNWLVPTAAPGGIGPNLSLWLKADQGVTGTTQVSQWDDQSSGALNATQATGANQPALTDNALNYNPAITFDGTDDFFTSALDISPIGSPDLTTIIVFNSDQDANTPFRKLFGHDAGNFHRTIGLDSRSGNNFNYFAGSNGVAGYFNLVAAENYISTTEYNSSNSFDGFINGFQVVGPNGTPITGGLTNLTIGAISPTPSEPWDGDIAEMIMYSGTLTGPERQRIETYLAIKYGISIDQTVATNYLASDGNPVWDGTANATYNQHIAGIGRDDVSELNQKQSRSSDGRLSIALGTFAASNQGNANTFTNDLAYLVWGDNGSDMAFGARDIVNVPSGIDSRIQRVWRVSEANSDVGNVTLRIDLNGEGHPVTYNPGNFKLLLDTDADFSVGAIELTADSYAGGIVEFNAVNIANGQFITLGINEPPLPPTDFVVYNSSATEITFEWADNAFNETGYQILEADNYGFLSGIATVVNIAANSTSYTHTPSADKFYMVIPTNGFEDPTSQSSVEFATIDNFPGQAIDFDGTGQYVSVADNDAMSFGDGSTDSPMSVEAWIYLDQITSRSIVSKRSGENEWHLVISSDGRVSVTLADQSSSGFLFGESPVIGFNTGEWYHIAFTYDGSSVATGINTYVNGVLQAQTPSSSGSYTAMENTNSPVEIGSLNSGASFNFDGQIDELKIWDFVKVDYSDRNAQLDLSNASYPAGLVAYYPLDEGVGSTTVDRSRNTNDGTLVGAPTFVPSTASLTPPAAPTNVVAYATSATAITIEWTDNATDETGYNVERDTDPAFGAPTVILNNGPANTTTFVDGPLSPDQRFYYRVQPINGSEDASSYSSTEFGTNLAFAGDALTFDGTNDQIAIPDDPSFDGLSTALTIEAWINTSSSAQQEIVSQFQNSGDFDGYSLGLGYGVADGRLSFSTTTGGTNENLKNVSSPVLSDGMWHHVAVSYDGTTATFYIDGVPYTDSGSSIAAANTNSTMYIGRSNLGTRPFNGQIDEVRIWDVVKSGFNDRFSALNGDELNLVAYYPFDEGTGAATVYDASANTNDGMPENGPVFGGSTVPVPAPSEVYNTSDSGAGSLRDAITYANANPGTTITFNISGGGPYNIGLGTALPDITAAGTIIDGTTQPGWTFGDVNNMVAIDGSLLGTNISGLVIDDVANCEIYGLIVTGFTSISESVASIEINGDNADNAIIGAANMGNILHNMVSAGISFQDADFLTIQGNRFGTFDGTSRSEINKHCIYGAGTTDNLVIGGNSGAGEGNLISGAGNGRFGLRLNVQGSIFIRGNYIGTNSNGDASIFNEGGGIYLSGANSGEIGGTSAGEENVISGNTTGYGIRMGGSASVINNIIGLDRTGTNVVSNGDAGIIIGGTGGVIVDGNIISGNGGEAITSTTGFGNAVIINNIIGFNQSITIARPNGAGIVIDNGPGTDNRFGYKDNPNIIANNTGAAIYLTNTSTGNTFATNQIYNNGSGIDLEAGANGSVAVPTIDNVTATDASGTGVDGTTIHLYLGDGAGQGQTFLDSTTVSGGIWSIPGLSLLTSDQVVATATDYGAGIGTSEFSAPGSIPVQNSLAFDGTDDHGSIGTNVFGGPYTGPFTIEAWVNSSLVGNNNAALGSGIFKNMESGTGTVGDLALTINHLGQIGLLNWREAGPDADGYTVSDASIPSDTWTHVAASWDGSVNRIFINGVEQSFTTAGTSTGWGAGYEIGRVNPAVQWHYDGIMDELRVWNVARSSVDITNNLYNELDPGAEVNLVAYYQFNQASGTNIPDAKGSFDATWDGTGGTNTTPAWAASTALMNPASVVTITGDTGPGSLREAINYANSNPGTTITFNIGESAPWVISLGSALPQITAANTIIDGNSQPGWSFGDPNAMVQINGSGIGGNANGINIDAADVEVYGLIFTGFLGNTTNGNVYLASDAADNAIIGDATRGNIFHASGGNAIYIVDGDNALIQGNRIGTLDGTNVSAMGDHGISTTGTINTLTIGGDFFTGEGNLISGAPSFRYGMNLFGNGAGLSNVTIAGNKIGTNDAASGAIPNTLGGINILGTISAVTIGGPSPSDLNVISGNGDHGIIIQAGNGIDIDGNYIGLQSNGTSALANAGSGIRINGAASNVNIGTNNQNIISENIEYGIVYDGNTSSNTALGTNIFSCNQSGGIGYGSGPLTPGGTIDNVSFTTATVSTAAADGSTVLLYFADDGCSNNQGIAFAGSGSVSSGQAVISGAFAPSAHYVALVEDINGFSEFSSPFFANFVLVTNTNDSGTGSFRAAIDSANMYPGASILFNIPGGGPWNVNLTSELQDITGAGTIIDGTTQTGWDINTGDMVTLNGSALVSSENGLTVDADNVEIYGLLITQFPNDGITTNVVSAGSVVIGASGQGNVINNNGNNGISIGWTNGSVIGNRIGTNAAGTAAAPNGTGGVSLSNSTTVIDNLISGHSGANDRAIWSNASSGHTILNNKIGTDITGSFAIPNYNGVVIVTGGSSTVDGNLISGNSNAGIWSNTGFNSNDITNNIIGMDQAVSTPIPNGTGVLYAGGSGNRIGYKDNPNIIAGNTGPAIETTSGASNNNSWVTNEIYNNGSGIVFAVGANNGIVPPTIDNVTAADASGSGTNGDMIHLYFSDGTGQGQTFIDSVLVSGGLWNISGLSLSGGEELVATATNATDGTSEFSTGATYTFLYPELEGAGEALAFDGTNDFVQIPSGAPTSFTAEAWVKLATTTDQTILKYTNSGNPIANISRQLRLSGGVFQHNTFDGTSVTVIGTTPVVAGEWYHVAITGQDAGVVRLYVNGVEEGTSQSVGTQDVSGNEFRIGQISTGDANFFNGEIDEVRIWDFVMPESSLREYMAQKVTNAHPSFANLIGYYRMDDTADAANLLDYAGSNTASIDGATYTSTGSGAHLGDVSIYEYTYTAGSGRNLGDFSTQNLGTANLPLHIYQVNQTPANNAASGFNTIDDALYYGVFSPGQTYQARYAVVGVTPDRRILSRDDLTDLTWETASGFLGTEVQDDQIISPVRFGSGQYVTATQSAPYPTEIDGGSALSLDGVDDFVDLGGSSDFSGHQNLTVEAWINPDYTNVSDHGAIISNLAPSVGGGGYQLSISNTNVRILYRDNTFTDRELVSGPLPEGEWSHLVGIVENAGANSNLYLYVNGIQVASALGATGVPDYTGITNMFIGSNSDGVAGAMPLDREFGGQLDEVRIWSTVLTETEIRDHMIGRIDPDVVAFVNLVVSYKFDDGDPNTAYDVAGSNDGSITGASKVISAAPQGQGSIYSYNAGPAKLSTAAFNEDIILNVDNATNGVHGYLIAGPPDQTSADGFDPLDQTRYYGVFAPGNPKVDIRMDYNNGGSPDLQRRIVYRTDATDNAAVGGWERVSGLINSDPTIDSVYAYNVLPGEFTTAVLNPVSTYPILTDTDPGTSLVFDGSTQYVQLPNFGINPSIDHYTIELWAKGTALGGTDNLIVQEDGSGTGRAFLYFTGNNLASLQGGGAIVGTTTINNDQWYHLAISYDGINVTTYIDGVQEAQLTVTPESADGPLRIGSSKTGASTLTGEIDEVRIWGSALAVGDILAYSNTTNLAGHPNYEDMLAYYKFDDGSGSAILEDVFANNDGSLVGMDPGTDWVASGALANATPNNALDFDGNSDYVNMPASIALKDHVASTVEAWIRLDDITGEKVIYSEERSVGTMYVFKVNAGFLQMGVDDGSVWSFATSSFPLNVGDWYHVAGTYADGIGTKVYINGVEVGSNAEEGRRADGVFAAYIGQQTPGPLYFHGAIDEVRLWTTERNQSQIQSNMLNELTGSEPGLRAYYTFNHGVADGSNAGVTTLLDQTTNVFHGTLLGTFDLTGSNSNWTASGAFNETLLSPANLITTEVTDSEISLTWEDRSASENSFAIFRSDGNNMAFSEIGTVGADVTAYSDNSVSPGNSYFYRVAARNGGGDSSPSNEKAAGTLAHPGNALAFDGIDDNITVPYNGSLGGEVGQSFTREAWIKVPSSITGGTGDFRFFISTVEPAQDFPRVDIAVEKTTGLIGATIQNGAGTAQTGLTGTIDLRDDTWHHVAYVRDAGMGEVRIYIDGVLDVQVVDENIDASNTGDLYIGDWGRIPQNGRNFLGEIDEVRIWNVARSEAEITSNMDTPLIGNEAGLLSYYRFDQTDPAITLLPDRSTNQNDGTLNGFGGSAFWSPSGATTSTPTQQNALNFDGNDYIDFVRQSFPTGLTYEAWVRTTSTANTTVYNGNPALTVIGDNNNAIEGAFGIHDGRIRYTHWTGVSTIFDQIDGTVTVNDGQWHHIAVSHQTNGDVFIYVDGVLDVTGLSVTYHPTVAANRVGASYLDGSGNDNFFDGDIDEVRIWNTPLPANEIRSLMYSDDVSSSPSIGNLILHYNFNQGSPGGNNTGETAVTDQSSSTLDGVLNGFALNGPTSNFITSTAFDHSGVVASSLQATNISPSNIMDNTVDITWTNGDGQRRIVAMFQGIETEMPIPSDNTYFNPDTNFGAGDVVDGTWHAVYNGYENTVSVSGLTPGTDYTIAVLEVNGPAGQEVYNSGADTDNPVNFTTTGVSAPEMEVTGLGIEIVSGDNTPDLADDTDFGNGGVTQQVVKTYTINNLGTADLNLGTDAVSASGDTAFEVGLQPDAVVTAGGSTTFTIVFTAPAENTFNSQILIFNDDADENPYTFDVTGVGVAAPPSQQASNIIASNIMDNTVDLSWTFGNGFGTVVAMFAGNDPFPVPIDNTTYTANAQFGLGDDIGGGWFVVYVGTGTSVSVTGLTAGQEYSVAALEYYGNAGVELYNGATDTNNPVSFTTTGGSDVTAPDVISLTATPNPITDVATQFELVVEFNENMDTGIDPTIDFLVEDPSATITFNSGVWDDAQNFRATYDVTDVNVDLPDIDVQVSGAQDLAGNAMNVFNGPDVFRIDTENPTITVDTYGTSITSPQLTGTVDDVSATISVDVDGNNYPATNNADGTWTLAAGLIASLADGTYDVVAYATDQSGNLGTDATTDELVISQTVVTLAAENVNSTSFTARWSEGLDVQTYQIDVSAVADFSTFVTGFQGFQTTATSVLVNDLDFATTYYYRVRLVNTSMEISANSNTTQVNTTIDPETVADSTALVQIFNAINPQGLNWGTDRLRDWTGISLDATRTRVEVVDINGTTAAGDMPNPFSGGAVGGLSNMTQMNASNNQITGLIDFSGTAINNLNVSGNNLEFDDLEPVASITTVDYSNQANLQYNEAAGAAIEVRYTTDYSLSVTTGGSGNVYTWFRNNVQISSGADFIVNNAINVILAIDYDNMGTFRTEVTNPLVPGLTMNVDPQDVLAIADMQVSVSDANGDPLTAPLDGFMLETTPIATGFPVLETIENVNASTFTFPDVVLGDYIILIESDLSLYIPTYFGNVFEWTEADTLLFRSDDVIQMTMTEVPTPLGPGDGDGTLDVLIEEDFGDNTSGRIDARRRASKRKCGLRRKRSGGRTGQEEDEFELIAYGETDDNGEFQFGFLPQGTYRFFVEYPGIPINESSFVQFDVGEAGISDTDFKLQAFATEDGIEVSIEKVLGVILEYFKDLEIFPNPSSSYLNIRYRHLKSGDVTAQLVDLAGNTKWSQDLRNGYDGQLRIDVTDFEEGVYILRFYDRENPQDNVVSFRVIVKD